MIAKTITPYIAIDGLLIRLTANELATFIQQRGYYIWKRSNARQPLFEVVNTFQAWLYNSTRSATGEMKWISVPSGALLTVLTSRENWSTLKDSWELLRAELESVGALPHTSAGNEQNKTDELSYLEKRIQETVRLLRDAGQPTGDEDVAAKLPTNSRGKPYTREWVNKLRNAMRKRGIDV